jgi:Domain of unknown function (DUF4124)
MMTSAKALAAAISWPRLAIVALGFGLLSLTAPAAAVEAVYIWRDATGAVRFSPVRESEGKTEHATQAPLTSEREVPQSVTVGSAKNRGPY